MPTISVVFDAVTGRYVANVEGMEKANAKAALSVAAAKNAILEATAAKIKAAKAEGASTEELVRIQVRGATRMATVTEANANRMIASLNRVVAKEKEVAQAMEAFGKIQGASSHGITDRMAASAVTRGLETGNVGIRAVENFITRIPGAGVALQAAFSVIGPVAFAAAVVEGANKLLEMRDAALDAGKAITSAYAAMHDSAVVANEDLAITGSKLQDELDKLDKRPNNGLATALLEAKRDADALLPSLQADRKEFEDLLKQHEVGTFDGMLSGVASTGKQHAKLLADRDGLTEKARKINGDFDAAISQTTDPAKIQQFAAVRANEIHQLYDPAIATLRKESGRLATEQENSRKDAIAAANSGEGSTATSMIDNSAKIGGVNADAGQLQDSEQRELQRATNFGLKVAVAQQTAANVVGKGAEEAARKAEEARRKAAEAQMKGFDAQLAEMRNDHDVSTTEEYQFWESMAGAAAKYPENLAKVTDKTGELYQRMGHELDEIMRKEDERSRKAAADMAADFKRLEAYADLLDKADAHKAAATAKLTAADSAASIAAREQLTARQLATGEINKQTAAMQAAAQHADAYAAKLAEIEDERKAATIKNDGAPQAEKDAANLELDAKRDSIQAEADRTAQIDAWAVKSQTAAGAFTETLQDLAKASADTAAQIRDLSSAVVSTTNKLILDSLTTRNTSSRHLARDAARELVNRSMGVGLGKVESMALGATGVTGDKHSKIAEMLGLHKGAKAPSGSKGDPLYMRLADLAGPAGTDAAKALINRIAPFPQSSLDAGAKAASSMGDSASSVVARLLASSGGAAASPNAQVSSMAASTGGFIGSALKLAMPFIPGFADGVQGFGGGLAWVGEEGPELLHLPRGSNVTPTHKLGDVFNSGGDTHEHHYHIDARGSTDPAQVRAQVELGIRSHERQLSAAAEHRINENRRRSINGGRG